MCSGEKYLTAQTCQLRDANETRLRIYETLEQSVAELERNNRVLQDEGKTDKKRIKAYVFISMKKFRIS